MTERRRDIGKKRQTPRGEATTSAGGLVKLFYRIGEVANIVGVAPHVLRYWESEFPSVKPNKSNHGQRVYTKRDVHQLLFIKQLLKEQGLTIAGARKQLRGNAFATFVRTPEASGGVGAKAPRSVDALPVEARHTSASADVEADGALPTTHDASSNGGPATQQLGVNSKSLRQALLNVRQELVGWLSDLG